MKAENVYSCRFLNTLGDNMAYLRNIQRNTLTYRFALAAEKLRLQLLNWQRKKALLALTFCV